MKKIYILSLMISVFFASCSKDNSAVDKTPEVAQNKIYASIGDLETRVQLNTELQTVWNEGDEITVMGPGIYSQWSFDGKTGDRTGSFSNVESYDPNVEKFTKYLAVYPAHGNLDYDATTAIKSEVIVNLPAEQKYVKGSYSPGANVMLGTSSDGNAYMFNNISSYLRLSLVGQKVVKKIQLLGNSKEFLAGRLFINSDNNSANLHADDASNSKTITLDCGEGVQLSDTPEDFYIVLPPVNLAKGFSIVVEFTDGTLFSKYRANQIAFYKNTIHPMDVLNVDPSDEDRYIYIYHSGDRVAFPRVLFAEGVPTAGSVNWDDGKAEMLPTDLEEELIDHVYTDGKPSHTISVQISDANIFTLGHCTGVSRVDFSNF